MTGTVDITSSVRKRLIDLGVSSEVAERVTAKQNTDDREVIAIGYPVTKKGFTRLKDAAITGTPSGGINRMFESLQGIATFLDSGMRATPASMQLPLPSWVADHSRASLHADLMQRAKALSRETAEKVALSVVHDAADATASQPAAVESGISLAS